MNAPLHSVDAHKKALFDQRVRELNRMTRAELTTLVNLSHVFVHGGPSQVRWSKDELINQVLRDDFPEVWA